MTARKTSRERRKEIVDAAIKIIGERGLREFTAAQVANEIGIKDGTIFRHFSDKHEIILAVLDRLQELTVMAQQSAGTPLERLEGFVLNRLHSAQTGIQSLIFSDQISHALGTEGPHRVAELRNRGREFIRSCLCEAAEMGHIRKDTDIECTVLLITGMVMSFLFSVKDGAFTTSVDDMEKRCWQTLLSILKRK